MQSQHRKNIPGHAVANYARKPPINADDAKAITNKEITLRTQKTDYDMIIKRYSSATNGLRFGSPSGFAQ